MWHEKVYKMYYSMLHSKQRFCAVVRLRVVDLRLENHGAPPSGGATVRAERVIHVIEGLRGGIGARSVLRHGSLEIHGPTLIVAGPHIQWFPVIGGICGIVDFWQGHAVDGAPGYIPDLGIAPVARRVIAEVEVEARAGVVVTVDHTAGHGVAVPFGFQVASSISSNNVAIAVIGNIALDTVDHVTPGLTIDIPVAGSTAVVALTNGNGKIG